MRSKYYRIIDVLKLQYKLIWNFFKINSHILIFTLLFVLESILFYSINGEANVQYKNYLNSTMDFYPNTFTFIFFENLKTAGITFASGLIPLFFGTLMMCFSAFDGLISTFKYITLQIPIKIVILSILPHGIFEFAAILLVFFIASILSKEITLAPFSKNKKSIKVLSFSIPLIGVKNSLSMSFKCFLLIVIPLLLIGAIVETTLSTYIAHTLSFQ